MTIIQAIILGIVQGLTELLPISSSAHLFLIPWAFNWNIPESFDVALHFGTLLAIGIFFFRDWIELIKGGYKQIIKKEKSTQGTMFIYIVIATIPGGAIGFILDKYAQNILTQPLIIAIALICMGIALYIVDKTSKNKKYDTTKSPKDPQNKISTSIFLTVYEIKGKICLYKRKENMQHEEKPKSQ